jgi:hypothetical protein
MFETDAVNPVTGLARVWHRHRLLMEDGIILRFRVDIGFPHTSFADFPHLLMLRSKGNAAEPCLFRNLQSIPKAPLLYLGSCVVPEGHEWCLWCDDEQADWLEGSRCVTLMDEVFFTENDHGVYYRDLLIPDDFRAIAEWNLALCHELEQEESIDLAANYKIRHWIAVNDKEYLAAFLSAVEERGFRLESTEDTASGVRLCLLEVNDLRVETRHHVVASLFDLAERVSGHQEGWEVDLTGGEPRGNLPATK